MDPRLLTIHGFLVAILVAAAVTDIRFGKVFNVLTYSAVLAGLALNAFAGLGGIGLGSACKGLLTGFLPLFLVYLAGGLGGGDVKLMAAVGAFLGPWPALYALLYTCLVGGILALFLLLWKEGVSGAWARLRRDAGSEPAPRFPFAVAILIGTLWVLVEGHLGTTLLDALGGASA